MVIDVLAELMLEDSRFDGIRRKEVIALLQERDVRKEELDAMLDGNALVGRKLVFLKDTVGQNEEDLVYFVFDELRDYCGANKIVKNHTLRDDVDCEGIIDELILIRGKKLSCEEGLIHYLYVFFRTYKGFSEAEKEQCCTRILDYYRISESDREHFYGGRRHREEFMNLGLKMICTTGLRLKSFEKEYITDCLNKKPYEDGGKLFDVMLDGTISGTHLDLKEYVDILLNLKDLKAFQEAFGKMMSHGSLLAYEYPQDLEIWHRRMIESDETEKAYQIQWVAEMFLLCFKLHDRQIQERMEEYFYSLPTHMIVDEEVRSRLTYAYGE